MKLILASNSKTRKDIFDWNANRRSFSIKIARYRY